MVKSTDLPVDIRFSIAPVLKKLNKKMEGSTSDISKNYLKSILDYANGFPKLVEGLSKLEDLEKYENEIHTILENIFPEVLTKNEIKAVSVPFGSTIFNPTARFKKLLNDAGPDYSLQIREMDNQNKYIFICIIILNEYYNYTYDSSKPLFADIPDSDGMMRHYRMAINADFITIEPKENAVEITPDIAEKLVQNVDDIDLWKTYFPKNSWTLSGMVILNLTDVTIEDAISDLKTTLLFNKDLETGESHLKFEEIFKSLFNNKDLKIGFAEFDAQNKDLYQMDNDFAHSFILDTKNSKDCVAALCQEAYGTLVKDNKYFVITDIEQYAKDSNYNKLAENLLNQGVNSCILVPLSKGNKLLAVLEVVSPHANDLNSINAMKLDAIVPYIVATIERKRFEKENRIKAVIQSECTSIHPSVLWLFEKEATQYITNQEAGKFHSFRDIALKDIYPLYGQIDIVGSSQARNNAIQKDITVQLKMVDSILAKALEHKPMLIYEQIKFRIEEFSSEIENGLNASSESEIFDLLKNEINPLLAHIDTKLPTLKNAIANYDSAINSETGIVYDHRKNYDDTVHQLNQKLAAFLDLKQQEAQQIYPHYFERYKTDGVDHNIYIGASIANEQSFNMVYLYNLRLWQLRTMCEMENHFYHEQSNSNLQLDAASMILVFSNTLSIKYRMDEKKFDVDGTYNARYEVVKKRIDKALVKGSDERITQKGKIAIIYSQDKDAQEYKRYIKYLQEKNYLGNDVEYLELEDVQGVIGLKAIRVNVLYSQNLNKKNTSNSITYDDLMEVLD
ncbi:GAF domain-containing protein [Flavimarina sp. Hel_I_48]|uniref:GAF domain-containing protein n=1 Tax=Flavimarina sp. Hel_I_48 TaxID=1392488 RepID=UPI0004DF59DA|nr:GAF domain-containing protein [Flavimarina sp. Hel_I_48]